MAVGIPLIVLLLMQRGLALQRTREKEHLRHGKSKDSARHVKDKFLFSSKSEWLSGLGRYLYDDETVGSNPGTKFCNF